MMLTSREEESTGGGFRRGWDEYGNGEIAGELEAAERRGGQLEAVLCAHADSLGWMAAGAGN
jgi:hypothetical protein